MTLHRPLVLPVLGCLLCLAPGTELGQADCGAPVFLPSGAICPGGSNDGRPSYVFDAGARFEPCTLSADGFESGDTGAWTTTVRETLLRPARSTG